MFCRLSFFCACVCATHSEPRCADAYELFVKKGPLGKAWIAGTMMKKLGKAAVLQSDIARSVRRCGCFAPAQAWLGIVAACASPSINRPSRSHYRRSRHCFAVFAESNQKKPTSCLVCEPFSPLLGCTSHSQRALLRRCDGCEDPGVFSG
jgi:hypothetical protein